MSCMLTPLLMQQAAAGRGGMAEESQVAASGVRQRQVPRSCFALLFTASGYVTRRLPPRCALLPPPLPPAPPRSRRFTILFHLSFSLLSPLLPFFLCRERTRALHAMPLRQVIDMIY